MSDSCNSRHFTWLVKSCLPNPNDTSTSTTTTTLTLSAAKTTYPFPPNDIPKTTLSSLPDDVVLECISRVPSPSIQAVSLVCRRWRRLVLSASFLRLRRSRCLLRHSLFALSASDSAIFSASLPFPEQSSLDQWNLSAFVHNDGASPSPFPSHARICSLGPAVFIVGRSSALRYDSWTGTVTAMPPTIFPRKKFAFAEVSGKLYIAGGGGPATTAVEEYDPETDKWRVVSNAPRSRYGCIGASADGVFYVIGGLKLGGGGSCPAAESSRAEAHVYAGSMDLYDVHARAWIRSRAVPGGGCVVAACAAAGRVYVLASHAVELSFWSFDGRRKGNCGNGGFGEWRRVKSPPLPAQVRVDGFVRFSCAGVGEKVVLVQASGCIDDLLRRSGRSGRGMREGLVLVYDPAAGEWTRAPDLPEVIRRAACVGVEC